MIKGTKYLGTSKIEISVANKEIIPDSPSHWTMGHRLYKFSIMNYADCTLIINGTELFLKANQGFSSDKNDASITSVKIKESGIEFNWIGAY